MRGNRWPTRILKRICESVRFRSAGLNSMATTPEQLKKLAHLKVVMRETDDECALAFGVSRRTIIRWKETSQYRQLLVSFQVERKEEARQQIASLADDVIFTMRDLMLNDKSGLVRHLSAKTLGEWMGLHEKDADEKPADDRTEALELLRKITEQTQPRLIMPPLPGGRLPASLIDVTPVVTQKEYATNRIDNAPEEIHAPIEIDTATNINKKSENAG